MVPVPPVATVPAVPIDPKLERKLARVAAAARERDALIIEAVEAGATFREVARVLGVSHVTVKNVVDKAANAKKPPASE